MMKKSLMGCGVLAFVVVVLVGFVGSAAEDGGVAASGPVNLALVAEASTSFVSGHETLGALNDGFDPRHSDDKAHGAYGNWPRSGTQWVEYTWREPISTGRIEVYWFDDNRGVRLPRACRIKYWDGSGFVAVEGASGVGLEKNKYNAGTFSEVRTTKLRLEMDSNGTFSTGVLEWKVYDSGKSPNFAPLVKAGVDRVVVLPGKTYLRGWVKDDGRVNATPVVRWSKASGPGEVRFAKADAAITTAEFSLPGEYVLKLTASDGQLSGSDTLSVVADAGAPAVHLMPVVTNRYRIDSPLWDHRLKRVVTNWIPHCYTKMSDASVKEGGIQNFVEAGRKLAGQPYQRHIGAVFANAWVHNTVEAMCVALMVDAGGDAEIIAAQRAIREKLDEWIPKILSAQEPDGYLQTCYTLNNLRRWTNKHDHEGYLAGYFIEAAIAHYQMTRGEDRRMYEAAKRLADCWYSNIGPAPKRAWYEGHQELEQALVRFGRFVDEVEGVGKGRKYVELAKFLMDSRGDGEEYDQSHVPVIEQYEAVGHAVRAVYSYSAMADLAMETGDVDYLSAVQSLWSNIVNRKYYVTGGVGSGETSEGFGKDYSLPHNAYCESCAGCGELFFQHKMNLIHHEAKYADLYEETLYNAILGSLDLEGRNFTYTNALDSSGSRYGWHVCPCCVGNIPRTLLMLPTWMYARSAGGLYINLFIGSTVNVGEVAGTEVQVVQKTEYPWSGRVSIWVNPAVEKAFAVKIRVPNRNVSGLYSSEPVVNGVSSMVVNGEPVVPTIERGYASLSRRWKAGDRIDVVMPMVVQRVKSSAKVVANTGRVALRYGPLVYNIESVDQKVDGVLQGASALSTEWKPDLLGGVVVIKGAFSDGTSMVAIPNYARNNRGGRSLVWIRDR